MYKRQEREREREKERERESEIVRAVSNLFIRVSYFCKQNPIFCPGSLWTYTMTK